MILKQLISNCSYYSKILNLPYNTSKTNNNIINILENARGVFKTPLIEIYSYDNKIDDATFAHSILEEMKRSIDIVAKKKDTSDTKIFIGNDLQKYDVGSPTGKTWNRNINDGLMFRSWFHVTNDEIKSITILNGLPNYIHYLNRIEPHYTHVNKILQDINGPYYGIYCHVRFHKT